MKAGILLRYSIVLIALACAPALAREQAPDEKPGNTSDVKHTLDDWKEAVEGGDVEKIMNLYDSDAIMISTFVQNPMTKRSQIVGYYKKVIANPDVKVTIEESHPRTFGQMAVNTGRYTLSYTQEGEPVVIPARFSFTYIWRDGKWLIVDQHSSRVPLPQEVKFKTKQKK